MGIWLAPVALVLVEAAVFLGKANWQSDFVVYFITFWTLRAVLAPLIVWYTLRFWVEHKKPLRLFALHAAGFLFFSLFFWSLAYLFLHRLLHRSEFFGSERTDTNRQIFSMLVDNSISTNSIVYASTVAFCYGWEFMRQNVRINKKALALEKSLLASRLDALKGQLNTHFLFNTLHTISSLVVRQQNEEANKMLVRLSELLRFSLKENKEQTVPLHREMELPQLYLDIQQIRFKERLKISVVQEAPPATPVPALLLQPLVENAVKYAVEPYSKTGRIDVDVRRVNGCLNICVKDNGPRAFDEIDFGSGIGIANTKERLQNLYPGTHRFSIEANKGGGVAVSIQLPVQTDTRASLEDPHCR